MTEAYAELSSLARRFSVCCRPLSSPGQASPLDWNCQEHFPAASVIKAAILSCLLARVEAGDLTLEHRVEVQSENMVGGAGVLMELSPREYTVAELATLMMVVSDNTASNACLRLAGMKEVNRFCRERGYDAEFQRYFMSPVIDGRDNRMTSEAAAKILADLYRGVGLSKNLRDFAVGVLRRQQYREKIPLMLPEGVVVGHKTGELDGVRHDAAVVEAAEPYLLVVLTAEGGAPWEIDLAIARCSRDIFEKKAKVTK